MNTIEYIIMAAYLLQGIEIIFFPLPSNATTYAIISQKRFHGSFIQRLPEIVPLALLTCTAVLTFMIPLIFILFPEIEGLFHPMVKYHLPGTNWISGFLILSGSTLTGLAVGCLHNNRQHRRNPGITLVDYNIFGWMRNPISVGLFCIIAGFFMAFPFWEMFAGMLIYIFNAHLRIRMEEQELALQFGDEYQLYKQRVGCYLPKIFRLNQLETEPAE